MHSVKCRHTSRLFNYAYEYAMRNKRKYQATIMLDGLSKVFVFHLCKVILSWNCFSKHFFLSALLLWFILNFHFHRNNIFLRITVHNNSSLGGHASFLLSNLYGYFIVEFSTFIFSRAKEYSLTADVNRSTYGDV